jgi:hypothetical protein
MDKDTTILQFSNPNIVVKKAYQYFKKHIPIYISTRKDKKYMLQDPNDKWVHFGQIGYEDHTKHNDENRRQRYLRRSTNIRGNWKDNPYSPNNLAINLLW